MNERLVVLSMMAINGLALRRLERPERFPGRPRQVGPNLALTGLLVALNFGLDRFVRVDSPPSGLLGMARWPGWAAIVATVVVLDGLAYAAHVLMHRWPLLWRVHRVHHSDATVDVTTAFRQHPLETTWRYAFLFVGATVLGASSTGVAVYLGLSALIAQLEHAQVVWPAQVDRAVRILTASPAMHRVHHSRQPSETDTNYANVLSFWDRAFGTYRAPRPGESIVVGLEGWDEPERQRTAGLLTLPFGPREG